MGSLKDNLLIIDDDPDIRMQLKWALNGQYNVFEAECREKALVILEEQDIQLVALDICLNPHEDIPDGISLLKEIRNLNEDISVVMVTGQDDKLHALDALKNGAFDYYQKPIDINELKVILQRALYIKKLEAENRKLSSKLQQHRQFQDIIGDSPEMNKVFSIIKRVASTDATLLITGESGTGKELVARAVHNLGTSEDKPFIAINCGAIPENLLESELFGHEKGAFTGAYYKKIGKFEDANNGIIFLDEIGDLYPNLQVKLLRFLQERCIERIGGRESIPLNVRIIAATNRDLEENVKKGLFRADLFYRLSVITLNLPPLRDRGNDLFLIANYYLNIFNKQYGKNIIGFSDEAEQEMLNYHWPGNVRELENKIRRAVIMSNQRSIRSEDLELRSSEVAPERVMSLKRLTEEVERKAIDRALTHCFGNITKAAKLLEISRPSFYDMMNKYDINYQKYKKQVK